MIYHFISFKAFLRLAITVILLTFLVNTSYARPNIAYEYQLKAVFLYNFVYFVRWPPIAFSKKYANFNICVLGKDPFEKELDMAVENETVDRRIVKIIRLKNITHASSCQILFVSKSERNNLRKIYAYLQRYPILTVSDIKNFAIKGGMVEFYNVGRRVRFYIAPNNAKAVGLKISANLLYIAKLVGYEKNY
ncbi:YfiR family protein [Candidatus Marithrix sp. Canyon 246]|uniref:YfiR family protein n=1 Tax=Candidatus Marithrix sp. Canyon 246 TaxID=1827136 RepID=UPI000849F6DA|nr:YfiR family protein [Candidatus Marithrix sp. Canyon 246]